MKRRENSGILPKIIRPILHYTTLVFITLRACDVIDWPWYAVLSPVIASVAVAVICCTILGMASVAEND